MSHRPTDTDDPRPRDTPPGRHPWDAEPLRVLFVITSMPVGGAETLLVSLVRRLDRARFAPEICCLKERGPLGEELAAEIPVAHGLLTSKFDPRILPRLVSLFRRRRIDAVITVGAGDKMFWGRLAARLAGVPVVVSALHSTGWPDTIGRLNRLLTPLTDAFIGVAAAHGRYLVEREGFPARKVHVIPNGVDVERFAPRPGGDALRAELGLAEAAPLLGIVAALRPEKDHALLLRATARVRAEIPEAELLVIGDGPLRPELERQADELRIADAVHFLGNRSDIPELLSMLNVFVLSSQMEANPVSILEAMAVGKPVVATRVGSVPEMVRDGLTGYVVAPGDGQQLAARLADVLHDPLSAREMGAAGRDHVVAHGSLATMVEGYETLIATLHARKRGATGDEVEATSARLPR